MKKVLAILLAMLMIVTFAACNSNDGGGTADTGTADNNAADDNTTDDDSTDDSSANDVTPSGDTITLALSFNQSESHPLYRALAELGENLYAETNGAYEIEIYANELLGNQSDSFEQTRNGTIQMVMVAASVVEAVNSDYAVLGLPYLYDSLDHQYDVFTSDLFYDLFHDNGDLGFYVAAAYTAGARCVYTDKPIQSPEDLAGYKIRVMDSATCIAMMNYMGGTGTPMGQGEVYTAIQQGVIEGGENNEVTYADLSHYEVAPYFNYTSHMMVPDLLVINSAVVDAMDDETRAIFDRLCQENISRQFELWYDAVDSAKETAIAGGATFVEDVDTAAFQANCLPLHDEIKASSDVCQQLYDAIRAMA